MDPARPTAIIRSVAATGLSIKGSGDVQELPLAKEAGRLDGGLYRK
jgi:hypothetical protein